MTGSSNNIIIKLTMNSVTYNNSVKHRAVLGWNEITKHSNILDINRANLMKSL